jgi:hypothetical protein
MPAGGLQTVLAATWGMPARAPGCPRARRAAADSSRLATACQSHWWWRCARGVSMRMRPSASRSADTSAPGAQETTSAILHIFPPLSLSWVPNSAGRSSSALTRASSTSVLAIAARYFVRDPRDLRVTRGGRKLACRAGEHTGDFGFAGAVRPRVDELHDRLCSALDRQHVSPPLKANGCKPGGGRERARCGVVPLRRHSTGGAGLQESVGPVPRVGAERY